MSIDVSYVMATRNHASRLDRTFSWLRDVLDDRSELIVIDGASTDETSEVLERNRDLITKLVSEPDDSEAHATNKGFLLARGEIIKLVTDDDYIYPAAMRRAAQVLMEHPELDVLMCGGRVLNEAGGVEGLVTCPDGLHYFQASFHEIRQAGICGVGLLFRRRALPRYGLLATDYFLVDGEWVSRVTREHVRGAYLRIHLFDHTAWAGSGLLREPAAVCRDLARLYLRDGDPRRALEWRIRQSANEPGVLGTIVRVTLRAVVRITRRLMRGGAEAPAVASTVDAATWDGRLL